MQSATASATLMASERPRTFSLVDSAGATVSDRSFRGDWLIVFFGFTHCADICPTSLFKLSRALESLGDQGGHVRVAFITIDPKRDSPQVLKSYLKAFGPRFTGLTGSQEQIEAAERTFRAYSEKQADSGNGNYAMIHSTTFYVLDPNGNFARQISAEADIEDLAETLRRAMMPHAA
jgi:protein SCO1